MPRLIDWSRLFVPLSRHEYTHGHRQHVRAYYFFGIRVVVLTADCSYEDRMPELPQTYNGNGEPA